jgi:recombination protein RecA
MVARIRSTSGAAAVAAPEQSYFAGQKDIKFISSGCRILNLALGGGWPLGRISNVIGDKSTGKTLLAIEACANFAQQFPKGLIFYREIESAFDQGYASALGMPISRVEFEPLNDKIDKLDTVEQLFADMTAALKKAVAKKVPCLYIVDSLDALSTEIDLDRTFGEQTYRTDKPTMLGELFRKQVRMIEEAKMHLMIISQVRDRIGGTYGKKYSRSGGRALDFYASHVLLLAHLKTLVKSVGDTKRATGVRVKAKCEKNKIGLPFREAEFVLRFGYGIDDLTASVEWLESVKKLKLLTAKKANDFLDDADDLPNPEYLEETHRVAGIVEQVWRSIDQDLLPNKKKYG